MAPRGADGCDRADGQLPALRRSKSNGASDHHVGITMTCTPAGTRIQTRPGGLSGTKPESRGRGGGAREGAGNNSALRRREATEQVRVDPERSEMFSSVEFVDKLHCGLARKVPLLGKPDAVEANSQLGRTNLDVGKAEVSAVAPNASSIIHPLRHLPALPTTLPRPEALDEIRQTQARRCRGAHGTLGRRALRT